MFNTKTPLVNRNGEFGMSEGSCFTAEFPIVASQIGRES